MNIQTELRTISLDLLVNNTGQVEGVRANPRLIKDEDYKRLKKSLRESDLTDIIPLKVLPIEDGKFMTIGGNMRLRALQELGVKETRCVVIPKDTPAEVLNKAIILDNSTHGEWDFDMLANEWTDEPLEEWGVNIPTDWNEETPQNAKDDDFDEDGEEIDPVCQRGDIWQLGDHRLMCGDSTSEEDVQRLMNGEFVDMFITDPPYGVSYTEKKNEFLNSIGKSLACVNAIQNDSKTPEEMYDFWLKAFSIGYKFSKDVMSYYVTAPQGGELLLLLQALRDAGLMLKHQMIWNKNNHVLGRCDYNYKHEPIIYGWKLDKTHKFYGRGQFLTSVWDIPKPLKSDLHPTMKPIALIDNMLRNNSIEGDAVLDLFGGSGTTLIACEQLGRKCYMMEIDPHYCDVIMARWENLTGKKAIKI